MKQRVYQSPAMTVVGLQPGKAVLQGVSGRKSYVVVDDNPFGGTTTGTKEILNPNLWDDEW